MNIENLTMAAAFFIEGLMRAIGKNLSFEQNYEGGQIELFAGLTRYATLVDAMLVRANPQDDEYVGVFGYEVSAPFGYWFGGYVAKNGDFPPVSTGAHVLHGLFVQFFLRAGKDVANRVNTLAGQAKCDWLLGQHELNAAPGCLPQHLPFDAFSMIAEVKALANHGRKWEVSFLGKPISFADGDYSLSALRHVHESAVNNALYMQTVYPVPKPLGMPSDLVLSEYPHLREKFKDVLQPAECINRRPFRLSRDGMTVNGKEAVDFVVSSGMSNQDIEEAENVTNNRFASFLAEAEKIGVIDQCRYNALVSSFIDTVIKSTATAT